jgi:hypothetical protein
VNFTGFISATRKSRGKQISGHYEDLVGEPIPGLTKKTAASVRMVLAWTYQLPKIGTVEVSAGGTMPCVNTDSALVATAESLRTWAKSQIVTLRERLNALEARGETL